MKRDGQQISTAVTPLKLHLHQQLAVPSVLKTVVCMLEGFLLHLLRLSDLRPSDCQIECAAEWQLLSAEHKTLKLGSLKPSALKQSPCSCHFRAIDHYVQFSVSFIENGVHSLNIRTVAETTSIPKISADMMLQLKPLGSLSLFRVPPKAKKFP